MTSTLLIGILASLCVFLTVLFASLGVRSMIRSRDDGLLFEEKLQQVTKSELAQKNDPNHKGGWYGFWETAFAKTGRLVSDSGTPGNIALGVIALAAGFGILVFPGGVLGGTLLPIVGLAGYYFLLRAETKKRAKTLESQMPNLLASIRSNLQSRATPQQAIINVANEFPSPLGDELRIVRDDMSVNIPMDKALKAFAERSSSNEIKFLVASIEIAVESGADLDTQLETIENIIRERREIRDKLSVAISQATPSIWVSGVFIPAGLVFSFLQSESNRQFWTGFFGLICLGVVGIMYAAGLFMSWKLIKGVENT